MKVTPTELLYELNLTTFALAAGLHGLPTRTGKLKDLAHFDATFFGVHAKQAHAMDPQLRMLLELTHEAIVDAGMRSHQNFGLSIECKPKLNCIS